MTECRHCGVSLQSSYRFRPTCATPQTGETRTRFRAYTRQQTGIFGGFAAGSIEYRLRYAAGNVAIVAGLATPLDVGGLFFLLAGLAVLPPVRWFLEERIDQQTGAKPTAGAVSAVGALVLVGTRFAVGALVLIGALVAVGAVFV